MKFKIILIIVFSSIINGYSQTAEEYYKSGELNEGSSNEKAILDYNKAIKINPKYVAAYYKRAMAKEFSKEKDILGAIADYSKVIELDDASTEMSNYYHYKCYHQRGFAKYFYLKDYKGAIADFNEAIKINPDCESVVFMNRGDAKNELQDYRGAILDYSKAIEIDPNNYNYYYMRGNSKYDLKDYSGALSDYSTAIEIIPSFSPLYYNRGLCKIYLGQKDSGCLDLSKAGELGNSKAYETIKELCN